MSVNRGIADDIRLRVRRSSPGAFFRTAELASDLGSRRAVETALSRLAASEEPLVRVRNGLYWRSPTSRFGKAHPRPVSVALELRKEGTGPAGWTAMRALGLTTQVPPTDELAVVGAAPSGVRGITFRTRTNLGRCRLGYHEIAALESLRTVAPETTEWPRLVEAVRELASGKRFSAKRFALVAEREPARVREAARRLLAETSAVTLAS